MQKKQMMTLCMLLMTGTILAQEQQNSETTQEAQVPQRPQGPQGGMPKVKRVSYQQITQIMANDLKLNVKQQKKIAKLNKKYKTLIEGEERKAPGNGQPPKGERPQGGPGGGGMPGGMGGGMPGGMGGGSMGGGMPGGQSSEKEYDYDKKQQKYDKAIGKILTEEQMEGYLKIKPQFASQRRIREFLLGNPLNMMNNENGL
jgi:hypothetical protein